jgi:predicted phage-related endonuclease
MTDDVWKKLRAENIGGSEVASLFGEGRTSYYQLWHIKRGLLEPINLDDVERVQAGKFMEKGAIDWWNYRYKGHFYQPHQYVRAVDIKGMGCTPDALDAVDPTLMAQVKIVDFLQFRDKWEAEGEIIKKAPLEILLQVQHEMECCNRDQSVLIVVVGGNKIYSMYCQRDRQIGQMIREQVNIFWDMNEPPEPDFDRDGDAILELRKRLPQKEFSDFTYDKNLYKLLRNGLKKKVVKDKAQDALDRINAEIIYIIENNQHVRCGDMLVSLTESRKTPKITSEKGTI